MNIVDCLYSLNKWWASEKVDNAFLYKRIRNEFSQIVKCLGDDNIITLTGPRGSGKTTLLYQTVDYLIKMKTPSSRIIMFSGDEPALFIDSAGIFDILKAYTAAILQEEIDELSSFIYVIIDEINRIKDWRSMFKKRFHAGMKIKFIITAPTLSLLFPQVSDELPVGFIHIPINPLTPQQFIEFYCSYKNNDFDYITYKSLLPDCQLFDDPAQYVDSIFANINHFASFRREKTAMLGEYLLAGGYPLYFEAKDLTSWQHRLNSEIIDRSLYSDILSNNNIKSPENLKKLLFLIAASNGHEQAYANIGKTIHLNTVTIINHLNMLFSNRFITICENYSGQNRGVSRKNKRIYLRDCGIKNALIRNTEIPNDEFEREIKSCCVTLAGDYTEKNGGNLYFWRNNQSEVDIVLEKNNSLLPISIIYKNDISRRDLRGIKSFRRNTFSHKALVITKDTLAADDEIYYLPFWLI